MPYICSWGGLISVETNSCNGRQELHKTETSMRSARSETLALVYSTGLPLLIDVSETILHSTNILFEQSIAGSTRNVAPNFLTLLKTDTTWTSAIPLKHLSGKPNSKLRHYIQWELSKSGYVLGKVVQKPKHQDKCSPSFMGPPKFAKRHQKTFETLRPGAGKTYKNIFILPFASSKVPERLWLAKIVLLLLMVARDLASSNAFAFI